MPAQDVTLLGLIPGATLRRIVDAEFQTMAPPPEGVIVNRWLADRLGIERGDPLAIEIREGQRQVVTARVVAFVDEPIGSRFNVTTATLAATGKAKYFEGTPIPPGI